jgi:hypothetical protein
VGHLKRETSADTAGRFVARRERARERQQERRQERRRRRARQRQVVLSRGPAAPPERPTPRRIALDLAEPTARLIHDVLLDALHANVDFGDRGALLMIAEQMVAQALGMPACDDPPLTDRPVPTRLT